MDPGWWLLIGVIIGVFGPLAVRFIYEWWMKPSRVMKKSLTIADLALCLW